MTNYRVESSSGRAARKMRLALMGPAFIAAIGYIDPGNFATNIQAGASFGYPGWKISLTPVTCRRAATSLTVCKKN